MNKSLLDTDILSEVHKTRNSIVAYRARDYRNEWGGLTFSSVTAMEIVRGLWSRGREQRLAQFLEALAIEEVVSFAASTGVLAGKISAALRSQGTPIGHTDPMIAATAIEHGLVLVTGNTGHFQRIQQLGFPLRLANWRESDS